MMTSSPGFSSASSVDEIASVLGVGTEYIPYALLCYIVPVFSVLCAFTGFGIWDSQGQRAWKKHGSSFEKRERKLS